MPKPNSFVINFAAFSQLFERVFPIAPRFVYPFMELSNFEKLFVEDVRAANRVYVQELLFRTHWAAITTIYRNLRWMNGMDIAIKNPNYFCFCACLRGLVESAADGHDALFAAMSTVATHFSAFAAALHAKFSDGVFVSDLEDVLIHYSHARRVLRRETTPETHRAKTSQEYLTAFEDRGSRNVRDLYAELCEITHPTASSVNFFGTQSPSDSNALQFIDREDMTFISDLLDRHDAAFATVFQKSFNAALLTLYVLNQFDDARFFTSGIDEVDFKTIPAFAEIESTIVKDKR